MWMCFALVFAARITARFLANGFLYAAVQTSSFLCLIHPCGRSQLLSGGYREKKSRVSRLTSNPDAICGVQGESDRPQQALGNLPSPLVSKIIFLTCEPGVQILYKKWHKCCSRIIQATHERCPDTAQKMHKQAQAAEQGGLDFQGPRRSFARTQLQGTQPCRGEVFLAERGA